MLAIIPESLSDFIADDDGRPVVMLNLLRFKPDGGRERYAEYLAAVAPVGARFGVEVVISETASRPCRRRTARRGTLFFLSAIPIETPSSA